MDECTAFLIVVTVIIGLLVWIIVKQSEEMSKIQRFAYKKEDELDKLIYSLKYPNDTHL